MVSAIAIRIGNIIFNKNFVLSITFLIIPSIVNASEIESNKLDKSQIENPTINKKITPEYLLGAGDKIYIQLNYLPEYSGNLFVQPDGSVLLPGLFENVYLEGLTIAEAKVKIINLLKNYVKNPDLNIFITGYRPITVYVKGEVSSPGLYTLQGQINTNVDINNFRELSSNIILNDSLETQINDKPEILSRAFSNKGFPTLYDAIKSAQGITPYSDLSSIKVVRNNKKSDGGGKLKAEVNFLSLFKDGDLSQNIRLFDQDVITIKRSEVDLSSQLIEVNKSNITPNSISVFVSGNLPYRGPLVLQRGAGLNQAISLAGGEKLFSGRVEFLRYDENGIIEKRSFALNKSSKLGSYQNPILKKGDIINLQRSLIGKTSDVVKEVFTPIVNSYTLYKIFTD